MPAPGLQRELRHASSSPAGRLIEGVAVSIRASSKPRLAALVPRLDALRAAAAHEAPMA